jgi:hypothetical protein
MLGGWDQLSPSLAAAVDAYYTALVEFVLARQDHGNWQAIAPGHVAEWLGVAVGDD